MSNEDIYFIKKYNTLTNIFAICIGCFFIIMLGFLVSVSVSGIIYDHWNNIHYLNFAKIGIITFVSLSIVIAIALLVVGIKTRIAIRRLNSIVSQNSEVQKGLRNQGYASGSILLNHALSNTVGNRKYDAGNFAIDSASMIAMVLNMRKVANELNSYLPEDQKPKRVEFKYIFIIVAILSLIPVIFGINVSLKDRNEIIKTREEVVTKLKSVYQDYNPLIDDYYHYKGYYNDTVDIVLNDESIIETRMESHGQGKITKISFKAKEHMDNESNKELIINNLLEKVELLYRRTNQYKYYYKEIFRDQVPAYQMDEEHIIDLIQKLDNLLYKNDGTRESQNQYHQNRETEPKTAVNQYIYLEMVKDENNNNSEVTLELTIEEHSLS